MEYKWLNREINNNKLIMFFNGWGMDENAVKHLEAEDYDVVMFYDYNNLETDFSIKKEYSEINLVAWSMGVMIAAMTAKQIMFCEFKSAVAINGTLKIVDDNYGIKPEIYELTVRCFDELGKEQFIQNMGVSSELKIDINSKRSLENQKNELIKMGEYSQIKSEPLFIYNKVYISKKDRIVPTKKQSAFWGIEPNIEGGHYPFASFSKWSELL